MTFTSTITRSLPGLGALRAEFGGELHAPGEAVYDTARQAWSLGADLRPALIALPRTAADVVAIVRYARTAGLRVAPQSTGHNALPLRGLEETILLKTSLMRGVDLDLRARRARAEAGALVADVLDPASEHGLAILSGSSPDVGIVGYALGGGVGFAGRAHGLCANTVTAIEVVLADGRPVRCDAETRPELFWALRGGGGSYAIVTAIELELIPMPELYGGAMLWPWERAGEILRAWLDWTRTAPESATTSATILQVPPLPDIPEPLRGRQFVRIDGAVVAGEAQARAILAPLRALEPEIDLFAPCAPAFLSRLHMDPEEPVAVVSDHALLEDLTPEVVERLVDAAGPDSGSPLLMVELRHWGGAVGRVPANAGALGRIPTEYGLFAAGMPMGPGMAEAIEDALAGVRDAVAPVLSERVYLNLAERPTDTSTVFAPDTFTALQAVKAKVDPDDLIHANHPVAPAAS